MGTKAAPGKGRELRPKWKSLSWVLHSPSLVRISQLLWDRRQSTSQRAERFQSYVTGAFPIFLPPNSPKLWAGTQRKFKEFSLALMVSTDILKPLMRDVKRG